MRIHLIAIGGSVMHNLAIALHKMGYNVTGSDDEIFEPAYSRLKKYNLLPSYAGWNDNIITPDIDVVIVGMHARDDNPELKKAKQLNISILSFPEFIYNHSKEKCRVVIGGSHGKTTVTSMIMHVLNKVNKFSFDYLVGAIIDEFETMVKLSNDAFSIIIEGDEYLASPTDRRPKFILYKAHIAAITGIAWDHINVFPTFDEYLNQFQLFIDSIQTNGILLYNYSDEKCRKIANNARSDIKLIPYEIHPYRIDNEKTFLITPYGEIPLLIFGEHNMQNISCAKETCSILGITDSEFYQHIQSFKGAAKRLEIIRKNDNAIIFRDFAHAPSKLKATIAAVKKQYPKRKLIACIELHTFSSLNTNFLPQYNGSMELADIGVVYYNINTIEHKKLSPLAKEHIIKYFGRNDIIVFNSSRELINYIYSINMQNTNLLIMSSGNFDGIDFNEIANNIIK